LKTKKQREFAKKQGKEALCALFSLFLLPLLSIFSSLFPVLLPLSLAPFFLSWNIIPSQFSLFCFSRPLIPSLLQQFAAYLFVSSFLSEHLFL
jgi:hypothetical protein